MKRQRLYSDFLVLIRSPGYFLPVISPGRRLAQCLFDLCILEAVKPIVEPLARIVPGPV